MAKVPLRRYDSEIETLIEGGQTDEAIAHCHHILKTFPKHLETYRLLGKAYLESKRHSEAADIFGRVLMSAPDDFVAHVGLSIIADEGKRLEDAIWHMERAFEKQPSNAAIQAELQRLYGRRDGHEPPKIRLTRGALAHMYYQGDLYTQAISEIRSVLAEDPNRSDLYPLLALAHFHAGQKVEASETCAQLIGQFPYCLEANRILVEILPGTSMAENVEAYRQRVLELDPYAAHARGSILHSDEAPDNAVSLERLEYKGRPVEASLGIELGAASRTAAQPEWLKSEFSTKPAPVPAFEQTFEAPPATPGPAAPIPGFDSAEAEPPAAGGEAIPSWMRQAGWGETTGTFDEAAASTFNEGTDFNEGIEEPELTRAALPDWIQSMAPRETAPAEPAPAAPPGESEDDTLDWLNKLGGDNAFAEQPSGETLLASGDIPDWLRQDTPAQKEVASPENLAETPDWFANLDQPIERAQEGAASEASAEPADWLSKAEEIGAASAAAETVDWLSKLDQPQARETPPADVPAPADRGLGELGTSLEDQDAAMLWLESLAAKQGAKSEELITKPEERSEKPPEWVEQAREIGESQPAPPAPVDELTAEPVPSAPVEELTAAAPDEPIQEPAAEPAPSAPEETPVDATGMWLKDLAEKESETEKPVEAEPASWSREIEAAPKPTGPLDKSTSDAELPSWLRGLETVEAIPTAGPTDEMPAWLKVDEEAPAAAEPTSPTDWAPEEPKVPPPPEAAPAPKPEARKPAPRKPEPKPRPQAENGVPEKVKVKRTGMLPPLIDPNLAQARDLMSHAKIPDALHVYGNLIRKGKLLEEVTFDLKEALYRFPVEVSIWQALGDAYMRANRLQDALDAYTKAEELLR